MWTLPPFPPTPKQEGVCANVTIFPAPDEATRSATAIGSLVMLLIVSLGVLLLLLMRVRRRGYYLRLQNRSAYMLGFILIGTFVLFYATLGREVIVGRNNFPCLVLLWGNYVAYFFVAGPIVSSLFVYTFKVRRARKFVVNVSAFRRLDRKALRQMRLHGLGKDSLWDKLKEFLFIWRDSLDSVVRNLGDIRVASMDLVRMRSNVGASFDHTRSPGRAELSSIGRASELSAGFERSSRKATTLSQQHHHQVDLITRLFGPQFYSDLILPATFSAITGLPFILMAIIRMETDPFYSNSCLGCDFQLLDYLCLIIGTSILLVSVAVALYSTRNEPDLMGVKQEMFLCIAIPGLLAFISWGLSLGDPDDINKRGIFSWQDIEALSGVAIIIILTYVPVFIAVRQRHFVTGTQLHFNIDAILDDERACNALLKHCTNELSSENVLFLLEVRIWKSDWQTEETSRLVDRARAIFETYISGSSEMTINIPEASRVSITNALSELQPDQKPEQELFASAVIECEDIVLHDSIPRFKKTPIFQEEIVKTGLINKITTRVSEHKSRHHQVLAGSETSTHGMSRESAV